MPILAGCRREAAYTSRWAVYNTMVFTLNAHNRVKRARAVRWLAAPVEVRPPRGVVLVWGLFCVVSVIPGSARWVADAANVVLLLMLAWLTIGLVAILILRRSRH